MPRDVVRSLGVFMAGLLAVSASEAALAEDNRPAASASVASDIPPAYASTVQRAVSEYDRGHYEEAHSLFLEAHALYPNARTLRGLGKVAFELRNYAECMDYVERALSSSERPLEARMQSEARALLAQAAAFVGEVAVDVDPPDALLRVDDAAPISPPPQTLRLDVGEHQLVFAAPGMEAQRRALRVEGKSLTRLTVTLTPVPVAGPQLAKVELPPAPPEAPPSEVHTTPHRRWLWVGLGALVSVGIVSAVLIARPYGHDDPAPATTANTPHGALLQGLVIQ